MSLVARVWLVAAVLSGAVLVALPVASSASEPMYVDVVDDAYDDRNRDGNATQDDPARNHTVVNAGDPVVWRWQEGNANRHTVTSQLSSPKEFDSDADCGDDKTACRTHDNVFVVRFDEPGTYSYYCKNHGNAAGVTGMVGTIEVRQAPDPSESPSSGGSSEPSEEPPSEQPHSEQPPSEREPSEGSSERGEEPSSDPDPADDGPPPVDDGGDRSSDAEPSGGRAPAPGFGVRRQPDASSSAPGPQVAPEVGPGPSFSPFPSAPDLPSASEPEDIAVTVPSRGGRGPSRGVVVGVAVASLIGSAGVLGKVVLFGEPWS